MEPVVYSDEWALAGHCPAARNTLVSDGLHLHDDVEAAELKGENHHVTTLRDHTHRG